MGRSRRHRYFGSIRERRRNRARVDLRCWRNHGCRYHRFHRARSGQPFTRLSEQRPQNKCYGKKHQSVPEFEFHCFKTGNYPNRFLAVALRFLETMRPYLLYCKFSLRSPPVVFSAVPCMTCARLPIRCVFRRAAPDELCSSILYIITIIIPLFPS